MNLIEGSTMGKNYESLVWFSNEELEKLYKEEIKKTFSTTKEMDASIKYVEKINKILSRPYNESFIKWFNKIMDKVA